MVDLSLASLNRSHKDAEHCPWIFIRQRGQEKMTDLRKRLAFLLMFSVTTVATALYDSGKALATESEGYKSISLAQGLFRESDVTSAFQSGQKATGDESALQLLQPTKGLSDVYVQSNTWAPGGSTGWHMHPGHWEHR